MRIRLLICLLAVISPLMAQNSKPPQNSTVIATRGNFTLRKVHDSLYWLNDWKLPYPVYQFQTGDVNGDGSEDAMVGVIKSTRFYPEKARRLFIFKQVNGKPRALWMGSKLGGILEDFRFVDGKIRALESTKPSANEKVIISSLHSGPHDGLCTETTSRRDGSSLAD